MDYQRLLQKINGHNCVIYVCEITELWKATQNFLDNKKIKCEVNIRFKYT